MKIDCIAYQLGSRIVSNDEIINIVKECSKNLRPKELDRVTNQILFYLNKSGSKERRWLAKDERPIDLVCRAINKTLIKTGYKTEDIDLLIHVGLCRGFLEAGQSYFIAQSMKMNNIHCFDIMDACNSWTRGMFIAYNLIKAKEYKRILIVNTECNMMKDGIIYPSNFTIKSFKQIEYSFAGLTLSDGVSATLLSEDNKCDWEFHFLSKPEVADYCAVPIDNYDSFCLPSEMIAKNGKYNFTSFASKMQKKGIKWLIEVVEMNSEPVNNFDWIFPHGHTKNLYLEIAKELGIRPEKLKWNTYEKFGNFASACIPIAIAMGIESGEVKKDQKLLTAVASGGMSFSTISFTL